MIATTNAAGHALSAWQRLSELFIHLVPSLAIIALVVLLLWVIDRVLKRRAAKHMTDSFARPIIMLILTALAIVVVILVVPVSNDATRGQLLTLLGLVLTAIIGLSSTTFVSNAMAGFLLRSLGNVRVGDFVRVGEHFGRVSERGLFHIELQTEDRDLTTLPNFFLMSNPMTVVSASGTVISATVSIGYDESDRKVKALLLEAAERAELRDGFVHIMELGDFSITYRVAGMLADVKQILTARSRLRTAMLRTLHDAGVEIVSPTFMNTRAQQPGERAMPARGAAPKATAVMAEDGAEAEAVVFDKAERAAVLDELKAQRQELTEEVTELRSLLGQAEE
ncbi:MAG: mechanosensitive ion channel family protein, partial [Phycisphaerales bacterium]|nr:mechanosensitive ion channel family protein [Phycisphaerales bacterium]